MEPSCEPSATVLCLRENRFKVEIEWRVDDASGQGVTTRVTGETGRFWFFSPSNVRIIRPG